MPKVIFIEDFDFSPAELKGRATVAYKKGHEKTVTTECWKAAKAQKKAKLAPKPKKADDDVED